MDLTSQTNAGSTIQDILFYKLFILFSHNDIVKYFELLFSIFLNSNQPNVKGFKLILLPS